MNNTPIMNCSQSMHQRCVRAGLIGLAATAVVALLWISGTAELETWELRTYDLRMQWRGTGPSTNQLVMISRDEKSEARFGIGIWDRAIFAKMITALHRAGASVIALDFHFGGVSPSERGGKVSDQALADAVASAGTVVLPVRMSLDHDHEDTSPIAPQLKQKLSVSGPVVDPGSLRQLPQAGAIGALFPNVMQAAHGVGHIGASSDLDGVYRRVPMVVVSDGTAIPALGLTFAAAYLNVDLKAITLTPGGTLQVTGATLSDGTRHNLSLPVDPQGNLFLDYVGRWADNPFHERYFSFVDVWDSIDGRGNEEELRKHVAGKAVLILHAALESDKRRTPFELKAPGGFILANTFNTIIKEGRLHALPNWQQWGLVMVVATAAAWLMLLLPLWRGLLGAGVVGGSYIAVAYWGVASFGMVLPLLLPVLGLTLATGGALTWIAWLSLGQVHIFEGQIQKSESTRLELQQELQGLQELMREQETHVQQLEEESARTQAGRLALEQELTGLHELRVEKEARVLQLERELAALQVSASAEQINLLQVRSTLEAELRRTRAEKLQMEHQSLQVQARLDHELDARTDRDSELRRVKEDLERTKHALAELPATRSFLTSAIHSEKVLSSAKAQELRKQCEEHKIITNDPGVLNVWKLLCKAAPFNKIILILGESGTGKERFAKAAHDLSRRQGRFIPVNMATIEQENAESRLFGHVKGAFTDAVRDHDGHFLQAHNGTLFLDEIGELHLNLQAKLLRVLEEKAIWSMGAKESKPVDVRVVCATNRDLEQEVKEGRFREDLYHRLNVITLCLPPLRERPDDIPLLATYFVDQMVQDEHLPKIELSHGAIDRLKGWPWRGNIRELKNVLEKAVVFADGSVITEHNLGLGKATAEPGAMPTAIPPSPITSNTNGVDLDPDEVRLLTALRQHSFAIGSTAEELDWNRDTVTEWWKGLCYKTLVKHGFDQEKAAASLALESGLAKLVLKKLNEYMKGLDKVVTADPLSTDVHAWCKKNFRNLPARYYPAVETLIRSRVV